MNILLWILQIGMALYTITGVTYMMSNYQYLANTAVLNSVPPVTWSILGIVQIILALGLVVPGLKKEWRKFVPISAACLSILSLLGIVLYVAYAGFPGMLWGLVPALICAFIAYKKYKV